MALEFRPPEDLINAYLNRPSPGQIASQGIQQALQTYAQMKDAQQKEALAKQSKDTATFTAMAPYTPEAQIPDLAKQHGLNIPSAGSTPPVVSTGTAVTPNEMAAQQSLPSEHPAGVPDVSQPPSLIDRWNQMMGGKPTSKAGLAKYKTGLETQKLEQDLAKPGKGPLVPKTHAQLLAQGSYDPTKEVAMEPAAPRLDIGTKESQQQDKLEEQYRKSFQQIRGDPALKRTEEQRDAAAIVYNRIKEVKDHGQVLNPIDYVDALGQIYKARTGSAPTNEVLQQARQATAKGNFGKAFTFVTGEQAPATTQDIMNSLQDMALSMGNQADKFHDGYMRSRMKPPKGLAHDRVDNVHAERGMSFSEATGLDQQAPGTSTGGWKYLGPKK